MKPHSRRRSLAVASRALQLDTTQFRASCHLCPWVAEFTCNDNASKARWRHYHTCHPGACMVSFRALERRVETQPIGKNFKGQLAWKCAFCTHGIPTSDLCTQNRVFRAYKRHRLKAHPKIPVKKWVVAQKKLRFQHHGAMLKRVQTLNATAGKVKSKAFSPEKWHIATWPLIQKYASGRLPAFNTQSVEMQDLQSDISQSFSR